MIVTIDMNAVTEIEETVMTEVEEMIDTLEGVCTCVFRFSELQELLKLLHSTVSIWFITRKGNLQL